MRQIPVSSEVLIEEIKSALGNPSDLNIEYYPDKRITIIYLSSLIKKRDVWEYLITPLHKVVLKNPKYSWEQILPVIARAGSIKREETDDLLSDLLHGYTVLHLSGESISYSFDTQEKVNREPKKPAVERAIRGPKISFVDDIRQNLSMIRRRIPSQSLRLDSLRIGQRSQTETAVLYLEDVVDPKVITEVHRRLKTIDIDGIIESGYIEQLITDNRWSVFPLTQSTERPDKVVSAILEGRVAIAVDGTPNWIIVPVTVNELYQSPEDYYFSFWFGSFLRFFRIIGNNLAVALPGLYIALLGVNPELLPIKFVLTVAGSRKGVALPLLIELILMEFFIEIFREASLRLPNPVGQTLGVTAGIVLGTAAVGAGLVSNATLVLVVITAIASYSGPHYEIGLSWRLLKYPLILAAAFLGLYGLSIMGIMIIAHAAIQNSFGVSYLSPWAPLIWSDLNDTVLRRPLWSVRRPKTYHPADEVRYRAKEDKGDD